MSSTNHLKEFDEFYESSLKIKLFEIYYDGTHPECIKKIIDRFKYMVDYNVPHGKKLRGLCAYESLLHLVGLDHKDRENDCNYLKIKNYDSRKLTAEAKAIGWCIEFVSKDFHLNSSL